MEKDVQTLLHVYQPVLDTEHKNLDKSEITRAIKIILKAYRRINSDIPVSQIDYNYSSYRFAYIYLYALCHTAVVRKHVRILESDAFWIFRDMLKLGERRLNLCSLGGGPGCDVIGILSCLGKSWPSSNELCSIECTVLDLCWGWSHSFSYVLDSFLKSNLGKRFGSKLSGKFVKTDLCSDLDDNSATAIQRADLITMVKFVSVVSHCYRNNSKYLQIVFQLMKPGSYLFFLDNFTGGFFEMTSKMAEENGLILLFRQKKNHRLDKDLKYSKYKFSVNSLHSSSTVFAVWRKKHFFTCVCL